MWVVLTLFNIKLQTSTVYRVIVGTNDCKHTHYHTPTLVKAISGLVHNIINLSTKLLCNLIYGGGV